MGLFDKLFGKKDKEEIKELTPETDEKKCNSTLAALYATPFEKRTLF